MSSYIRLYRPLAHRVGHFRPSISSSWFASDAATSPTTFADVTVKITDPSTESKRSQFKKIPLDYAVLRHLDGLNLGFVPKARQRQKRKADAKRAAEADAAAAAIGYGANAAEMLPRSSSSSSRAPLPPLATRPYLGKGSGGKQHADRLGPAPFDRVGVEYATVGKWSDLPRNRGATTEVAICGRSNVGKSSLLNILLNLRRRPQLRAGVSATPGATQKLHFYSVGRSPPLTVVDLPGYGFAYAAAEKVDDWTDLQIAYLRHRNGAKGLSRGDGGDTATIRPLKRLLLCIDARHGLKKRDREFLAVVYDRKATASPVPDNVKLPAAVALHPSHSKDGDDDDDEENGSRNQVLRDPVRATTLAAEKALTALARRKSIVATSGGGKSSGVTSSNGGDGLLGELGVRGSFKDMSAKEVAAALSASTAAGNPAREEAVATALAKQAAVVADPPKLQVVLTKCDLVDRVELVRRVTQLRQELADLNLPRAAGRLPVVMLSSLENKGVLQLQRELSALVTPEVVPTTELMRAAGVFDFFKSEVAFIGVKQ